MSTKTTFPALLDSLQQALVSASEATEKIQAPIPPKDGISLLDVKNELFLSYLQNLVFLIILKLRHHKGDIEEQDEGLDDSVVKKLVELQVYLEKGVRPLESKLKYQIDKVLRAADDAKRAEDAANVQKNGANGRGDEDGSSEEDDDKDGEIDSDAESTGVTLKASEIDDLQYRPNPSSFVRPAGAAESDSRGRSEDGVYKPPRIQATAMPTTTGPREKEARRPNKSATLDEFVSTELSSAPLAEPSIGSTIVSGGRRSKSEKEKKEEQEKREYEERNYVRLPKESKKERAKKGGRKDAGYGGEEWRGLGEGIDRIERLTKRKDGPRSVVEKSRKRPTEDGPRGGDGVQFGAGMQKRLKTLDGGRRDRGRK
ncbi:related to RNA binding protein LCP5 [Phialocephala subalpina]|uniref:Related to RNA binding protein LCP5 n=1 Tax=Phialocephala subalpina TaxID=576137 RepID=A0A1L7XAX5_9HELO|nr:related to RNA binding protein LCP5 [Phialocephala subalpina]